MIRHSGGGAEVAGDEFRVDLVIARIAGAQQNLISIRQLLDVGLGRAAVWERVRSGRLHPKHRGVFAVGTPSLPPWGRERAALLAVGSDAVLSHQSAAAVWGMLPVHPSGPVEITVTKQRRSREGIRVHRTKHLAAADVRTHRGFALTSPARVVLDLAPRLSTSGLERVAAEAIAIDSRARGTLMEEGPERVRHVVRPGPRRTRSQNERALLRLVKAAGLPLPETNAMVAGWEVDAWWPEQRLVVEVDDFFTHGDRVAFERDRKKDAALTAAGLTVMRMSAERLAREPVGAAATLAQALARAA